MNPGPVTTVLGVLSCVEVLGVIAACWRSRSLLMLAVALGSVVLAVPALVIYVTGELDALLLSLSAVGRLLLYGAIIAAVEVRSEQLRDPRGVDATPRPRRAGWHL